MDGADRDLGDATRRRVSVAMVRFLLTGLPAGVWAVWPPPPGVTLENFRRLRPGWDAGMTEVDVQQLFGDPGERLTRVMDMYARRWRSGDVQIVLFFTGMFGETIDGEWSGRLSGGWFSDAATGHEEQVATRRQPEETTLQRFRRWLGI